MIDKVLYHYTSFENFKKILISKKLWLVSSREMNDITDRFYSNMFVTSALLRSKCKSAKLLTKYLSLDDIMDMNIESLSVEFYSMSFCKRFDNETLWEKYAGKSSGVCIELNYEYLRNYLIKIEKEKYIPIDSDDSFSTYLSFLHLEKVKYGTPLKLLCRNLNQNKHIYFNRYNKNRECSYYKYNCRRWLLNTYYDFSGIIKHKDYYNEDETRLFFKNQYYPFNGEVNPLDALDKMRFENALKTLGLIYEKRGEDKRRFELDISPIFDSNLIKTIIIRKEFCGCIEDLKGSLDRENLYNTQIIRMEV